MTMATLSQAAWDAWVEDCPLRVWRRRNGYTIMRAATEMGVSMTTIRLWERGVNMPGDETMPRAKALLGDKVIKDWMRWLDKRPGAAL